MCGGHGRSVSNLVYGCQWEEKEGMFSRRKGGGCVTRDTIGASCVGSCDACYALDHAEASFGFRKRYGWGDEVSCVPAVHMYSPPLYSSQIVTAISRPKLSYHDS